MLHKRHWPIRGTVRVIAGPIHASVLVPTVRQRRWVRCAPLLLLALAGRGLAAPVVMTAPDVEGVAAGTHPGHATQLDEAERMARMGASRGLAAPDPAALPHRGHQDRSMDGTRNHPNRSPNRPVALV